MKICRRFISFGLIIALSMQGGVGFAQSTTPPPSTIGTILSPTGVPYPSVGSSSPENLRSSGKSFGQKESSMPTTVSIPFPGGVVGPDYGGWIFYQVHILGEVEKPGTYRIPASTRLYEALQVAGGVSGQGSERRIELRRTGGGGHKVDLLSFKRFGHLDDNPYLLDNDVIFVPLRDKVIRIEGTVKRPGVYELKNERTLEDMVRFTGGLTPGSANPAPIKIIRFNHQKKEIIQVANTEESRRGFELQNGDVIVVPHFLTENKKFDYNLSSIPGDNPLFYPSFEERIFVLGGVTHPGPFPYNPYYNMGQYLTLAGGFTKLAKRNNLRLVTSQGTNRKAKLESEVNPGDAIIVPEKYMPPETFLSLVLGVSASILGITTTVLTLTR